ncbi:MAG: ribosome rescue protein RqcH [Candidatus Methanospirareceae archaeon]
MKEGLSSLDIAVIVAELQELVGARVEKVYQLGEKELKIKLYKPEIGTVDLLIEAGRKIHITKFQRIAPKEPSSFSMLLRKHLNGGRIVEIRQMDFDRIVEIRIERGEEIWGLIAELLPKDGGNVILVDDGGRIVMPLKRMHFSARIIKPGEEYKSPPSRINPLEISKDEEAFRNICKSSEKDIVRVLASELSLGGLYAEEICYVAGVEKNKKAKELKEEEIRAIHKTLSGLFEPIITYDKHKLKPHIVIEESEGGIRKVDVLPFELNVYKNNAKEFFPSFNEAVDKFFTEKMVEEEKEEKEAEKEKRMEKYERVLRKQEEALSNYKRKEEECLRKAEMIYYYYKQIEEELRAKKISGRSVCISLHTEEGDVQIEIDPSLSLERNAQVYYERAKEFRRKREGVEKAIEETKEKMRMEKERSVEVKEIRRKKEREKKEWYERFRWFVTSDGFLVIGGKDAKTNEEVVKRYMDNKDLFFHTQAEGSPAVIVKTGGERISEDAKEEVAQFTASYSNLWKYGFYEGDCYCVSASQVSKTPPSGEYIKKGSFVIRGKREYFKTKLGLYIGIEKEKGRVIACPSVPSLREKYEVFVEIEPGDKDKKEIAREIAEILDIKGREEEIIRLLPAGKSKIIRGNYVSPL